MAGRLFLSSAVLGMALGILAVLLMFWPIRDSGYGGSLDYLGIPLAIGAITGLLVGLICGGGAYVAVEIRNMKGWSVTGASQAVAAGTGAAVAGLLPAMALVAVALNEADPAALMALALGVLAVCFASGFSILTGLNRCRAHG